ncbi:MAG: leucyl/phenylalanyl-tRNA--protein transferase [Alphaproteobacteria bacterium]|nr:leucyl/phenylalanyl-tRNA--protein transferase [Alphaproteobacteria bacterium]
MAGRERFEITPDLLLRAYAAGLFPMAERRDSERLFWLDPEARGILPLDGFHLSKRLHRTVRAGTYEVRCDSAFAAVMAGCAAPGTGRGETWINPEIERLYDALHAMGHAHSIECWHEGALVGGLYGVSLGAAFFGESMFSRARDASKVALVHLVARLRLAGFSLLDTQFVTGHLSQFGAIEIARAEYRAMLAHALEHPAAFPRAVDPAALAAEIDRLRGEARDRGG